MDLNPPTEVTLPSGATLRIPLAPFADGRALYQTVMAELRGVTFVGFNDVPAMVKDMFSIAFSSKALEAAVLKCAAKCTIDYSGQPEKFSLEMFELADHRGDYIKVLAEVAKANVLPFGRNLYADFKAAVALMNGGGLSSKLETTTSSSTPGSAQQGTPAQ